MHAQLMSGFPTAEVLHACMFDDFISMRSIASTDVGCNLNSVEPGKAIFEACALDANLQHLRSLYIVHAMLFLQLHFQFSTQKASP
jgi:hypothetical protein